MGREYRRNTPDLKSLTPKESRLSRSVGQQEQDRFLVLLKQEEYLAREEEARKGLALTVPGTFVRVRKEPFDKLGNGRVQTAAASYMVLYRSGLHPGLG